MGEARGCMPRGAKATRRQVCVFCLCAVFGQARGRNAHVMATRRVPNHQKVGTLVAPLAKEATVPSATPADALSPLMQLVHEQITKGPRREPGSDCGFAVWDAPLMGCHLRTEGHLCAAQLRCNSVCVIKMRDDGCTFYLNEALPPRQRAGFEMSSLVGRGTSGGAKK